MPKYHQAIRRQSKNLVPDLSRVDQREPKEAEFRVDNKEPEPDPAPAPKFELVEKRFGRGRLLTISGYPFRIVRVRDDGIVMLRPLGEYKVK